MGALVFEANAINRCRYGSANNLAYLAGWSRTNHKDCKREIEASLAKLSSLSNELVSFEPTDKNTIITSIRLYDPKREHGGFITLSANEWFKLYSYSVNNPSGNTFIKDWRFYILLKSQVKTQHIYQKKFIHGGEICMDTITSLTHMSPPTVNSHRSRLQASGLLQYTPAPYPSDRCSTYVFSSDPADMDIYLKWRNGQ